MTQDYNAAFTGLNAAMIDYYGHSNFQPYTDCGLDLGWSHPNATNFPNWPADDCYHTCNKGCVSETAVTQTGTNQTNQGGENAGVTPSSAGMSVGSVGVGMTMMGVLAALMIW